MGNTYTRQTSPAPSTGDTIQVTHLNAEFTALVNAFDASSGHSHDGTTGEGGPVTTLYGNTLSFGTNTDSDIAITFNANTNDGVLTWMEDEDQFKFDDDIQIIDDKKIIFGTGEDVTIEYDEDGTDTLLVSGDATFADDKKLYFGTNKDAYIEYDEDGTDTWDFSPPAGGMKILDDKKLYFGTGGDAYIEYDEDGNDTWVFSPPAGGLQILDDKKLVFGDGSDVSIEYDEDGEDRLRIEGAPVVISGGEGEAGDLHLYADQGDDAGDEWKISVADGGTLTFGNDLNSAGTYVTHATITPNATVADSTVTLGGSLNITTVAAAGTDTDKFLVLDGSGNVDYRTGTQVLSDIGGVSSAPTLTGSTDNTVVTVTGSNAIAGEANFTYDGADGALASSTSNKPVFTLKNTNTDANGSILKFVKDAGEAGATNDISGLVSFYADDADQNNQEFGRIAGRVVDATSGGEEGALDFYVAENDGTVTKGMEIKGLSSDTNITVDISTHDGSAGGLMLAGTLVTPTATELNLIDGGTARGTTSVASGDGILINDAGTMRMTNVDTVSTYFASHSVGGSNIVTTGALNSGSITSGFGTIDTGSSAITTTGLISGGSLDIDNVLINGTTIGHTDDTDLITVADGLVTVAGEISVTTLDIGGTNITATAAELNYCDGVSSNIQTQLNSAATVGKAIAMAIVFG